MTDQPAAVARTEHGQFVKGQTGNPAGRPSRKNALVTLKQDLEIAIREHLTVDRVKKIVNRMADMAEQGNVSAAKLILDKVIANAKDGEDEANDSGRNVTFRIVNATFAALPKEQLRAPIDAEVIDVTPIQTNQQETT